MTTAAQLAQQFRDIFLATDFAIGTSYKKQLGDINHEDAVKKAGDLNTIGLLVFHIDYYLAGILKALQTGTLEIHDRFSFDATAIETQEAWEAMCNKLYADAENFAQLIEPLRDDQLQEPFIDGKYGNHFKNITGMIEHAYYHLGQIVLIKKMLHIH